MFLTETGKTVEKTEIRESTNVIFYIYAINGMKVLKYLDFRTEFDKLFLDTVIMPSGCEFIVCNKKVENGITHIYLREMQLGVGAGTKTALWIDNKVNTGMIRQLIWMKYYEMQNKEDTGTVFVNKNSSSIGIAYLESIFFKLSLLTSESFVLVQSNVRDNEGIVVYGKREKIDKTQAGINMLQEFKNIWTMLKKGSIYLQPNKIQTAIYTGKELKEKELKELNETYAKFIYANG